MKQPKQLGKSQTVGLAGEDAAVGYLESKGFAVVERNYWKKWGEIDIVVKKAKKLHFVEVKAVSHETEGFAPEDRVHREKLLRMGRTIETYLLEREVPHETDFQVDVLSVYLGGKGKEATFDYLPDVYFE